MNIYFGTTGRGFAIGKFEDMYRTKCSIQKSSLATDDAIWLGIDDPDPKIMASQAAEHGIKTDKTSGWVTFPIPSDVSLNTRMHLNRDQVAALIPVLQNFVNTGEVCATEGPWYPIDTAPEEGVFLVYMPDATNKIQVADWGRNIKVIGNHFDFDMPKPTLWSPLINPPGDKQNA